MYCIALQYIFMKTSAFSRNHTHEIVLSSNSDEICLKVDSLCLVNSESIARCAAGSYYLWAFKNVIFADWRDISLQLGLPSQERDVGWVGRKFGSARIWPWAGQIFLGRVNNGRKSEFQCSTNAASSPPEQMPLKCKAVICLTPLPSYGSYK